MQGTVAMELVFMPWLNGNRDFVCYFGWLNSFRVVKANLQLPFYPLAGWQDSSLPYHACIKSVLKR